MPGQMMTLCGTGHHCVLMHVGSKEKLDTKVINKTLVQFIKEKLYIDELGRKRGYQLIWAMQIAVILLPGYVLLFKSQKLL